VGRCSEWGGGGEEQTAEMHSKKRKKTKRKKEIVLSCGIEVCCLDKDNQLTVSWCRRLQITKGQASDSLKPLKKNKRFYHDTLNAPLGAL
jgi:hypothetical protein